MSLYQFSGVQSHNAQCTNLPGQNKPQRVIIPLQSVTSCNLWVEKSWRRVFVDVILWSHAFMTSQRLHGYNSREASRTWSILWSRTNESSWNSLIVKHFTSSFGVNTVNIPGMTSIETRWMPVWSCKWRVFASTLRENPIVVVLEIATWRHKSFVCDVSSSTVALST